MCLLLRLPLEGKGGPPTAEPLLKEKPLSTFAFPLRGRGTTLVVDEVVLPSRGGLFCFTRTQCNFS